MKRNPYIHALLAGLYIALIVFGVSLMEGSNVEESIMMPMAALSLFVLSAAIMGYLFLFEPGRMYFEGMKQEAVLFFAKTVITFAFVAAAFFLSIFLL